MGRQSKSGEPSARKAPIKKRDRAAAVNPAGNEDLQTGHFNVSGNACEGGMMEQRSDDDETEQSGDVKSETYQAYALRTQTNEGEPMSRHQWRAETDNQRIATAITHLSALNVYFRGQRSFAPARFGPDWLEALQTDVQSAPDSTVWVILTDTTRTPRAKYPVGRGFIQETTPMIFEAQQAGRDSKDILGRLKDWKAASRNYPISGPDKVAREEANQLEGRARIKKLALLTEGRFQARKGAKTVTRGSQSNWSTGETSGESAMTQDGYAETRCEEDKAQYRSQADDTIMEEGSAYGEAARTSGGYETQQLQFESPSMKPDSGWQGTDMHLPGWAPWGWTKQDPQTHMPNVEMGGMSGDVDDSQGEIVGWDPMYLWRG